MHYLVNYHPYCPRSLDKSPGHSFQMGLPGLYRAAIFCDETHPTAYDILRHNGIQVGKTDFPGAVPAMKMSSKIARMMARKRRVLLPANLSLLW